MKKWTKRGMTNAEKLLAAEQNYNEVHFLPSSKVGLTIIAVSTITDFMFFKQIIDYHQTESAFMVWLIAFVMAAAIGIIPPLLVSCIIKNEKSIGKFVAVSMAILAMMEISILFFNAQMRIADNDLIFGTSSSMLQSSMNAEETANNGGQKYLAILMCIIPVTTAAINLTVGLLDHNRTRKVNMEAIEMLHTYDDLIQKEAEIKEIDFVMKRDFNQYVDEHEKLVLDNNESNRRLTYNMLKLKQALASGNPEAASDIMDRKSTDAG